MSCRWRGDLFEKKQYWFPANYVVEIEPQDDSADNAPLGNLQKGSIDITGCIPGTKGAPGDYLTNNILVIKNCNWSLYGFVYYRVLLSSLLWEARHCCHVARFWFHSSKIKNLPPLVLCLWYRPVKYKCWVLRLFWPGLKTYINNTWVI